MQLTLSYVSGCSISSTQRKARLEGLWNLFLPGESGLSQLEYAVLAEITGRCPFAPEVFNCSAPGTYPMWKPYKKLTPLPCIPVIFSIDLLLLSVVAELYIFFI